jgi:hypothetical protein
MEPAQRERQCLQTTEDIPRLYTEILWRFSVKQRRRHFPPHRSTAHAIDLDPGYNLPCGRIYNLSEFKFRTLKAYIEANLANGFSQHSSSPILIPKEKDGGLRLCVDDRGLNKATVKNRYPLPIISEMVAQGRETRIFTKLDLHGAYNLIRMKKGDEFKTAFR